MLLRITNACRATVYADVCDDPDGSCRCVASVRLFVRGERFAVEAHDRNTFCLRGLGWVTLPPDCFALHRFAKMFVGVWTASRPWPRSFTGCGHSASGGGTPAASAGMPTA
jgi:hypothetical protein